MSRAPRDFKATMGIRLWALRNVFVIWLVSPSVLELSEQRCAIRIPLNWRTRNHLGSMYLGVLAVGGDVAGGLIAFHLMKTRKVRTAFVFKDMRVDFLKRAEGDVVFSCEDGQAIQEMMGRAAETGERHETTVTVIATVPEKLGDEPVARFQMTLSVKRQ